jgi:hypothetical protein
MEKAKRHPANPKISGCWRPVIQLLLGLAFILLACTVIFGIFASIELIPIYEKVSVVRDWDVPPETEVIGFKTSGIYPYPFRLCDEFCPYTGQLYVASDLSISDLEDFYRSHSRGTIGIAHIQVRTTDDLHRDGRPIHIVSFFWVF